MADFNAHILQGVSNLEFLGSMNQSFPERYDWQVTVAFYTAVHLVNAHLAKSQNLHYRSHEEVKDAISPTTLISLSRIDESPYLAYVKLSNCSRRARYLVCDNPQNKEDRPFYTSEKYLARAIKNLDIVLRYFESKYGITNIPKIEFRCPRLRSESLSFFKIVEETQPAGSAKSSS